LKGRPPQKEPGWLRRQLGWDARDRVSPRDPAFGWVSRSPTDSGKEQGIASLLLEKLVGLAKNFFLLSFFAVPVHGTIPSGAGV